MKIELTPSERDLIDVLTYANYRHNRTLSPDIKWEQWDLYGGYPKGSVERMEKQFQKETE
jgi:hypothetical protein|tara:strand:- start:31 stop:210 length:180 start_codon:yes stop_codon:yes gene_type:complete